MTTLHLSLALVMITAFHFAGRWDGTEEAEKINAGRRIAHWWELTVRLVFLLLGLGVMYLIHDWLGTPQWKLFCVAGMAFGSFVPTHRYFVNTRRTTPKRAWWWMGRSIEHRTSKDSVYDGGWHWIAWKISGGITTKVGGETVTVYTIDTPARYAYGFEAFVLILSTTIYVLA